MVTSHFQMTFPATHLVSFNTDWKIEWGPQLKNYFCKNLSRPFLVCDVFLRRMRIRGSFGVDFFSKHSKWSLKFKLVTGTNSQPLADFCLFWMRGILRIQPNSSRNSCRTASTKVGQFKRHCCRVLVVRQGPRKDLKCCSEGFETSMTMHSVILCGTLMQNVVKLHGRNLKCVAWFCWKGALVHRTKAL